jgi:transcriptional regulator with XRE-family HTH domain
MRCMTANHGEAGNSLPQYEGRVPTDSFSNRLVLARRLAGVTIEQAAEVAGLSKSSWANWENGRRPQDRLEVCRAIADTLDVDYHWLVFGGALLPARGRPTKRRTVDTTWNRPRPGGPGQVTNRPPRDGSKVRVDRVRPISVPSPGRRANYVDTNRQTEARAVR